MRRVGGILLGLLLAPVVAAMTAWAAGALYYSPLPPDLRARLERIRAGAGAWYRCQRQKRQQRYHLTAWVAATPRSWAGSLSGPV